MIEIKNSTRQRVLENIAESVAKERAIYVRQLQRLKPYGKDLEAYDYSLAAVDEADKLLEVISTRQRELMKLLDPEPFNG